MKLGNVTSLALLGIAAYVAYKVLGKGGLTDSASSAIASLWLKLFPLPPTMEVLGNVKFPGNIMVPLAKLAVREDSEHRVFTQYAGHLWQLQPSNEYGNWPAVLVK